MNTTKNAIFACAVALGVSACGATSSHMALKSMKDLPQGNYYPAGRVYAEKSFVSFFSPPELNKEQFLELEQEAIKKVDADFMVDYTLKSDVSLFWIVYTGKYTLEGQGVKSDTPGIKELFSKRK